VAGDVRRRRPGQGVRHPTPVLHRAFHARHAHRLLQRHLRPHRGRLAAAHPRHDIHPAQRRARLRPPPRDRPAGGRMSVDFSSPAEFRTALVAWLDERRESGELTPPTGEPTLEDTMRQFARVLRMLYDAGWSRYGWPERAGGLGGPDILRAIVGEEVVGRRLAEPGPYSMLEVLAPTMIDYAPPELAAEMVPKLLSGEEQWCQGFSEPGAGSDLASLSTRAVRDGDRWIINGQKVWTSFAQYSHRCILLTRTGDANTPNHQAISAFFIDLDTPGITVRPL